METRVLTDSWKKDLAQFQVPSLGRSLWQLANTLIPYVLLWWMIDQALNVSFWLALPLIFLASGFLVRAFIIFHDCGHGSFFKNKKANDVLGVLLGLLVFTPYHHWRWEHALHHATSGDLDRRGLGDMWMLTVDEYQKLPVRDQWVYRMARNPWVLFMIAPVLLFTFKQRFHSAQAKRKERWSVYLTTPASILMAVILSFIFGFERYLVIQFSILAVATSFGVWLFYLQHQYEGVYWARHEQWDFTKAALEGSSFYQLPKVLQFFSGNIGFHHLHHLNSKIPNYYLEECHRKTSFLQTVKPLSLRVSFRAARLALWDEKNQQLIRFDQMTSG